VKPPVAVQDDDGGSGGHREVLVAVDVVVGDDERAERAADRDRAAGLEDAVRPAEEDADRAAGRA
jgi:hypothetical protein